MTKTKLFLVDVFLYSHNLSADNVLTLWGEILCLLGSSLLKLKGTMATEMIMLVLGKFYCFGEIRSCQKHPRVILLKALIPSCQ